MELFQTQYDVFEQMHYVCFHYEFEHDPFDPDEECTAGGALRGVIPTLNDDQRTEARPKSEVTPFAGTVGQFGTTEKYPGLVAYDQLCPWITLGSMVSVRSAWRYLWSHGPLRSW